MKKVILLLAAIVMFTGIQAQEPTKSGKKPRQEKRLSPEEASQKQANRLEKELLLDAQQKDYVKSAALSRMEKEKAIHDKYMNESERKAMREEIKAVRETFYNDVNAKLNAQQQKKWQEMREKQKQRMEQKRKGGAKEPPVDEPED